MDAVVSRLHHALVDAIRQNRPMQASQPISVAEIYQELVPYRNVRSLLGVEMNADYEYALLRLLAGEGGYARLEPAEAREALRLEIGSPNPNVSLYRKFAGCDVWLDLDAVPVAPPPVQSYPGGAQPAAGSPVEAEDGLPAFPTVRAPSARSPFVYSQIEEANGRQEAAQEELARTWPEEDNVNSRTCGFCNEPLPQERAVNFCPFCGADQRNLPCASCGEVLESGWRFCPSCGATVAHGPSTGAA
jgi:RNA polymerase subunit RPABC4/transcription elongation factor Spt4